MSGVRASVPATACTCECRCCACCVEVDELIRAIARVHMLIDDDAATSSVAIFVTDTGFQAGLLDAAETFSGPTVRDALLALAQHVLSQSSPIAAAREELESLVAAGSAR